MRAGEILALAAGPASHPGFPCWTSAAALPGQDGSSLRSWVARIWGWTSAPAPSTSHVSAPATCPAASRSGGSLRSLPARSTWCSCSRPCSPFPKRRRCCTEISRALTTGGRFAFTMEEGLPLTEAERESMPDADTVWLTPLQEMLDLPGAGRAGVCWQADCSLSHRAVADSLIDAFAADATEIAGQIGQQGTGGAAGRPPALERLAAARTGPQVRLRCRRKWRRHGRRPRASQRRGQPVRCDCWRNCSRRSSEEQRGHVVGSGGSASPSFGPSTCWKS